MHHLRQIIKLRNRKILHHAAKEIICNELRRTAYKIDNCPPPTTTTTKKTQVLRPRSLRGSRSKIEGNSPATIEKKLLDKKKRDEIGYSMRFGMPDTLTDFNLILTADADKKLFIF